MPLRILAMDLFTCKMRGKGAGDGGSNNRRARDGRARGTGSSKREAGEGAWLSDGGRAVRERVLVTAGVRGGLATVGVVRGGQEKGGMWRGARGEGLGAIIHVQQHTCPTPLITAPSRATSKELCEAGVYCSSTPHLTHPHSMLGACVCMETHQHPCNRVLF